MVEKERERMVERKKGREIRGKMKKKYETKDERKENDRERWKTVEQAGSVGKREIRYTKKETVEKENGEVRKNKVCKGGKERRKKTEDVINRRNRVRLKEEKEKEER